MPLQSIPSFTGTNVPGNCWFDFVPCTDIDTFPDEDNGNLSDTITLNAGAAYTRIVPGVRLDMLFRERWKLESGVLVPYAELTYALQKDDLNKLPGLWKLATQRHVILIRNRNDQVLCMGTKDEGARCGVAERTTGKKDDLSGYELSFTIARATPVPFYNGTAPDAPAPGSGTGVIGTVTGIDITGPPYDTIEVPVY